MLDREYIISHLVGYTEFQMKQGYEASEIREALLKYGYSYKLVNEVMKKARKQTHAAPAEKPEIKALNEELYTYLNTMLVEYIAKELEAGYELDVIEKALIRYGHHPTMVRSAVRTLKHGEHAVYQATVKIESWATTAISLGLVFLFMAWLMIKTDTSSGIIFLSFAPAMCGILISYLVVNGGFGSGLLRVTPLIASGIVVLIYIVGLQVSPTLGSIPEPGTVLVMNTVLGFVGSIIICMFSRRPRKAVTAQEIANC
jgi:hypothetical protein